MTILDNAVDETLDDDTASNLPPIEPAVPAGKWVRDNLFSSVGSGILTVVSAAIAFFVFRSLLNFAFHNPARNWAAVPTNIRLMMTQAYPESQYVRVWVSLGIVVVLAGLTLGLSPHRPVVALRRILSASAALGSVMILSALLIKNNIQTDADGEFIRDEDAEVLRIARSEALAGRWWVFAAGGALIALAAILWLVLGDRRRFIFFPFVGWAYFILGLLVLSLWVVPYGNYGLVDGAFIAEKGVTVQNSTQMPWTVMWLLLGASFLVARLVLRRFSRMSTLVYLMWLVAPYIIIFVILRDPMLDWAHVWSTDVPMFLAFALVGGAVLWLLTRPNLGEPGKIIAALLLALAIFNWVAAFFGWYAPPSEWTLASFDPRDWQLGWFPMLQKARLSFLALALFALAASNFAGERKVRLSYVGIWIATMAVMHYLITMVNTAATVENDAFIGGFLMTIIVTVLGMTLSFPLGILFALARTSTLPIFRIMATFFIEVSRGIPFITVLFFFATMIPLFLPDGMSVVKLAAGVVALVLFSGAYMAENIRGGLQSVRRGQFEAADALGLTTVQRVGLIVLPQALRVSIPPLVGQAISTYKETSLLAIIGLFDFLFIANNVIPAQGQFRGQRFEPLVFVCVIYWIGAYAMSRYSRNIEERLGVGTR